MDIGTAIGQIYLPLILLFALAFYAQRVWQQRRRRRGKEGFYPSYSSLGNAFQELQLLAEPRVKHVIEEKQNEEVDDDDEGGPKDPTEHLRRQIKNRHDSEQRK